jgi:hypothetical protein
LSIDAVTFPRVREERTFDDTEFLGQLGSALRHDVSIGGQPCEIDLYMLLRTHSRSMGTEAAGRECAAT